MRILVEKLIYNFFFEIRCFRPICIAGLPTSFKFLLNCKFVIKNLWCKYDINWMTLVRMFWTNLHQIFTILVFEIVIFLFLLLKWSNLFVGWCCLHRQNKGNAIFVLIIFTSGRCSESSVFLLFLLPIDAYPNIQQVLISFLNFLFFGLVEF